MPEASSPPHAPADAVKRLFSRPGRLALIVALGPVTWLAWEAAKHTWTEYRDTRPPRMPVAQSDPALAGLAVREVSLTTTDGVRLAGWYIPSHNGAAVAFFHGYGGNRQQLAPDAAILARRGYGVLLIDMRAHGASGGERTTYGDLERNDVSAAIDFLARQPETEPQRIGVLGFSAGASPAAAVAVGDARIRAVVLEAAMTSIVDFSHDEAGSLAWFKAPISIAMMRYYGVDMSAIRPIDAVAKLSPKALLVVHGEQDTYIPPARARALYEAAREPKALQLLPGVGHEGFAKIPSYPEALIAFFDRHLAAPTGTAL